MDYILQWPYSTLRGKYHCFIQYFPMKDPGNLFPNKGLTPWMVAWQILMEENIIVGRLNNILTTLKVISHHQGGLGVRLLIVEIRWLRVWPAKGIQLDPFWQKGSGREPGNPHTLAHSHILAWITVLPKIRVQKCVVTDPQLLTTLGIQCSIQYFQ